MVTKNQLLKKGNQLAKASSRYYKHYDEFMKMLKNHLGTDDLGDYFSDQFIDHIELIGRDTVTMSELEIWIKEFRTSHL